MADETLFGWVHLSDIHFGHGDTSNRWDQELVLRALERDIAARPVPVRIDAVLVTGDIAFSGGGLSADEYQKADKWLREVAKAAGVGVERVFLVPGNHDVNRGVDAKNRNVLRLVQSLRPDGGAKAASLDESLKDAGDREMLASRMAGYLDFAAAFGPWAGAGALPPPAERIFWVQNLTANEGLRVRLIGLNTALLCKNGDRGKLALGREQLVRALHPPAAEDELLVILTHHPLRDWVADHAYADGWLRNNAHVHLSGHVHEADSEEARSGTGGQFVRVVAGAAHGEAMPEAWIPATHGYSFGEVRRGDGDRLMLRVHPRLWSEPRKKFLLDVHHAIEGATYAEHELRLRLRRRAAAVPPAPPEHGLRIDETPRGTAHVQGTPLAATTGPVRIYISHAPEDAELCTELEKHLKIHQRRGLIESWTRRAVDGGGDWRGVVDAKLREAHVVLLLLSNDFLSSDYCFDVEMKIAEQRYAAKELIVVPVLARPTDLRLDGPDQLWFEKLRPVPQSPNPKHSKYPEWMPVTVWDRRDDAWTQVAVELRKMIETARNSKR